MKQQIKVLSLIVVVFAGSSALAEATAKKSALHVDFNSMIESNMNEGRNLHKSLDQSSEAAAPTADEDRAKVKGFIDVEDSVGQTPSVVVRRNDGPVPKVSIED